ncbi:MAG TPA: peptidyl-prolyl cis-trans isomerase [Solirubrobacterales bacterium]
MSPNQGRRPASGKGGKKGGSAQRAKDPAALRRLALLAFGAVFIVLFVVVAIAEGLGDPSIPSGDVVLIQDAPGDVGHISEAEFQRSMKQASTQTPEKKVPKPGDPKYKEVMEAALGNLIDSAWLRSEADEQGLSATQAEVEKQFKKLKKENFKTEAEYKKFLKESGFTQKDVDERVELQMLSEEIQKGITENAPSPSQREIENYYQAALSTQFTQPETRDIRLVVNKDKTKAESALKDLESDNSPKNWKKIASKYSEDELSKSKGGFQKGIAEGVLEEPLNEQVFNAPKHQVDGLIKTERGYNLFEVENSTPETTQELKTVEAQIKSQLEQQAEQESFTEFVSSYTSKWKSRTFCADGFVIERCRNFTAPAHPATAEPACYEANPKTPPKACPAPVFQLIPAMPGTVTPVEPRGTPLAQRPIPAAGEEETPTLPTGTSLPPGTSP